MTTAKKRILNFEEIQQKSKKNDKKSESKSELEACIQSVKSILDSPKALDRAVTILNDWTNRSRAKSKK